ncbi:hypothetical protein HKX48_000255 [Thoreauomyces humboldtii]|nr:hypothetical protein HKX48_000255 [Thoreauomyces humboldtii]
MYSASSRLIEEAVQSLGFTLVSDSFPLSPPPPPPPPPPAFSNGINERSKVNGNIDSDSIVHALTNDDPPATTGTYPRKLNGIHHHMALANGATTRTATPTSTVDLPLPTPTVTRPIIPAKNNRSLILPLRFPTSCEELPKPKRCDHISMAYFPSYDRDGNPSPTTTLEVEARRVVDMLALATEISAWCLPGEGEPVTGWDLVYYELVKEELEPETGGVHEFREIRRWALD